MTFLRHCLMQLRNRDLAHLLDDLDIAAIELGEPIDSVTFEPHLVRQSESSTELIPARDQTDFNRPYPHHMRSRIMTKTTPNPMDNVTKMLEQFKVPGIDMTAFIESRRKDIDALVEANKAAQDAMQALARKQTEMLTEAMQGIEEAVMSAASGAGGIADPAKQAELARKAYQKTLSDLKELADMARKQQSDAMASLTRRAATNMADVQKMMRPK